MTERRQGVQSINRALSILQVFESEAPRLGLSEIARRSGLTTSTTHRLLASLLQEGIVMRVAGSNDYMLGPELLRLGAVAAGTLKYNDLATPIMTELRDLSGETVGLHVPDRDLCRRILHQVVSEQPLRRIYTEIGIPVPLHQGAPGKVLLAFLPEADQEKVLARPMERATDRTIVAPEAVRAEVGRVRSLGYAISKEERVSGITSVAVPIFDHSQRDVIAALSISGPASRLGRTTTVALVPDLQTAASRLSGLLRGAIPPEYTPEFGSHPMAGTP